jgi:hypothetical protein
MNMSQLKMGDFFDSPYLPSDRYMFLHCTLNPNEQVGGFDIIVHAMRVADYLMVKFVDKELTPPKELKVDSVKPGDQFFHGGERFTKLVNPVKLTLRDTDTLAYDKRYGLRLFSTQARVEA